VLGPNEVVQAENIVRGANGSVRKREGIDKNWDDETSGSTAIIGGLDYWYLSSGVKTQLKMSVDADGTFRSYSSAGAHTELTVDGVALSSPTNADSIAANNLALFAMDGTSNRIKKYSGTGNVDDLQQTWDQTSVSRSSSGTTRTLVLDNTFRGITGDYVVITGGPADYNGTFQVTGTSTTTSPDDTITYTASGSLSEGTTADTSMTLQGLAPNGSFLSEHQGRVLTNDKVRPDRLHYSAPGGPEVWGGYGDSGAFDVVPNDGDPDGITAAVSFRGDLYIFKRTKIYRISGLLPFYTVQEVSGSIGCLSNQAIVKIDTRDVLFVSEKGVHSLVTTEKFGDVEDQFISAAIQPSFNDTWTRKSFIKASYLPTENLVGFAVTETGSTNNSLWLYSVRPGQEGWFTWPDLDCETLFLATDSDRKRWYFGASTTRIHQTFDGNLFDTDEAGASAAIKLDVQTGKIQVEDTPEYETRFKRLMLYYTPKGNQTITGSINIDRYQSQSVSFNQGGGGTTLANFILSTTNLGSEGVFGPYSRLIKGIGRSIQVRLIENSTEGEYSIEGIGVEYLMGARRDHVLQPEVA
jgi:hypothetical protein